MARWMPRVAIAGIAVDAVYAGVEVVTHSSNGGEAALRVATVVIVAGVAAWLIDRAHHVALTCLALSLVALTAVFLSPAFIDELRQYEPGGMLYGAGWLFVAAIVTGIGRWYGPRDGT